MSLINKTVRSLIVLICVTLTVFIFAVATKNAGTQNVIDLAKGEFTSVGGQSSNEDISLVGISRPPSQLTRSDYEAIYVQASSLLKESKTFRECRLQPQIQDGESNNSECPPIAGDDTADLILDSYYASFNSGELLNAYCPDFDIDDEGNCGDGLNPYRNRLIKARKLFATLYLSHIPAQEFNAGTIESPELVEAQRLGLDGMLEATRELAYAHMIFGSEYAIDAFDYRYTLEGLAGDATCSAEILEAYQQDLGRPYDPNSDKYLDFYFNDADCIIKNEISLLEEALQQYQFGMDVMVSAYHDDLTWPKETIIGELFNQEEVEVFSIAMANYAGIIDELAIRHRQLGDEDSAIAIYAQSYDELILLSIPLSTRATQLHSIVDANEQTLLESNLLSVKSGISLMSQRLEEIDQGINVFGFSADHVPIQSYAHMSDAANDLFNWAAKVNDEAINVVREFDINASQLDEQMIQVQGSYKKQLGDLCGNPDPTENGAPDADPDNDYEVCIGSAGSLMEQSWLDLSLSVINIELADARIQASVDRIEDIQSRQAQLIEIKGETQETTTAVELAKGMARANRVTNISSVSETDEVFESETRTERSVTKPGFLTGLIGGGTPDAAATNAIGLASMVGDAIGNAVGGVPVGSLISGPLNALMGSTEESTIEDKTTGKRHSETTTTSTSTTFDPSEIKIAELNNVQSMALFVQDITILGIDTEFEIRDQLRQIAQMQIEKEIAVEKFNQASSRHNYQIQQYRSLKALYRRSRQNLNANYLANPAYRLLRDHKTEEANYQLLYSAQKAYLAGRALEYHLADEIPFLEDIFKVRHTSHIQAYLFKLEEVYGQTPSINEVELTFSLREMATGIRDQDISSASADDRPALIALRQELFSTYLENSLQVADLDGDDIDSRLLLIFDTSLANRPISSSSRYNWRIAGAVTGSTDPSYVDRCPSRKPYGVTVQLLPGAQTLPNGMTVDLSMSGHTSTRHPDGSIIQYAPQMVTLISDEDLPTSLKNTLTDSTANATINVNSESNTISDFCNMSVASTNWILEIPIEENQISWELFQDVKISMWTFYYDN